MTSVVITYVPLAVRNLTLQNAPRDPARQAALIVTLNIQRRTDARL